MKKKKGKASDQRQRGGSSTVTGSVVSPPLKHQNINNLGNDVQQTSPSPKTFILNGVAYVARDTREASRPGRRAPKVYTHTGRSGVIHLPGEKYTAIGNIQSSMGNVPVVGVRVRSTSEAYGELMSILQSHSTPAAYHNSGERHDAPRCFQETRTRVLEEIMDWVIDNSTEHQFLWIHGPAGSGKTSIAQTIAEMCEKKGHLASDFFFSRSAVMRNVHTSLVPTLASQLAVTVPAIRPYMARAIRDDTHIFSRSLQIQLDSLILGPFTQLPQAVDGRAKNTTAAKRDPHLIIIDALDECGQPDSQKYVLSSLSSALQQSPAPLIFLISSRPEKAIRDAFNGAMLNQRTHQLHLDDSKYEPDEDIRHFLCSKFKEITKEHPLGGMLGSEWPPPDIINLLVERASGQFVYASTVIKFVESHHGRPYDNLNMVVNFPSSGISETRDDGPFAELDDLYRNILMSVDERRTREKVLTVFAFLFATSQMEFDSVPTFPHNSTTHAHAHARTPATVEDFLGYKRGELMLAFADLHSIVHVPQQSAWAGSPLRLYHPSLLDFLQDRTRAGCLFVDMGMYSAKFASICVDHMMPWLYLEDTLDALKGSPTCQISFQIFLQLFAWEHTHSDSGLLRVLAKFPIHKFISRLIHGKYMIGNLGFFPLLFRWLEKQDVGLHNEYEAHYENHIKSRLLLETVSFHPRWRYIFTAVSLYPDSDVFRNVFDFLDRPEEQYAFRKHFFPLTTIKKGMEITDYLGRLGKILVGSQSTEYDKAKVKVDHASYVDLAIEFFECFTVERTWMASDWEKSVNWRGILDVFSTILFRIPRDPRLLEYLKHNRQRPLLARIRVNNEWMKLFRVRVDAYVQESEPAAAISPTTNGSAVHPNQAVRFIATENSREASKQTQSHSQRLDYTNTNINGNGNGVDTHSAPHVGDMVGGPSLRHAKRVKPQGTTGKILFKIRTFMNRSARS